MSTQAAAAAPNTPSQNVTDIHPNLVVSSSKAYKGLFTKMRDANTPPAEFAFVAKRAMRLLSEDAIAELPSEPISVTTPTGSVYEGTLPPQTSSICAVSIIRAGDSLLESVRELLPGVPVGKILIQRDETTEEKTPIMFYSKMPPGTSSDTFVMLCDPMLATSGSARMAIETLVEKYGVKEEKIVFVNVISSPEGLRAMAASYPKVKIVTSWIDEGLNDEKYIVPGLGDYGDRFFNTV